MKKSILILLALTSTLQSFSRSSKGKEFWIGFMENISLSNFAPPFFQLHVSSELAGTCTVSIPQANYSATFAVLAQQVTVFSLPTGIWYPQNDENIVGTGIHLQAQDSVELIAFHQRQYFTESTLVLPVHELGTDYIITAADDTYSVAPTEFVVVALQNNTIIEIDPRVTTVSNRPAAFPFTATLQAGEVYQIMSFGDLSGTIIKSLSPANKIAVFSGAMIARIGCNANEAGHMYEQMMPVQSFGTRYHVVPFLQRYVDVVKVVASQVQTSVSVSNGLSFMLTRGQSSSFTISAACEITSDKPISVAQFATSKGCNFSAADTGGGAGMLYHQPSNQKTTKAYFYTMPRTDYGSLLEYKPVHNLNIVLKTNAIGNAKLDNVIIAATNFSTMPGNAQYSYARLPLDTLTILQHTLSCDSGFSASIYCFTYANFYGHHLGFAGPTTPYNGTGIAEEEQLQTKLYPNPSTTKLNITSKKPMVMYTITDISGRSMDKQLLNNCTNFEIDLTKRLPGYYILSITYADGSVQTSSFMKVDEK